MIDKLAVRTEHLVLAQYRDGFTLILQNQIQEYCQQAEHLTRWYLIDLAKKRFVPMQES